MQHGFSFFKPEDKEDRSKIVENYIATQVKRIKRELDLGEVICW
jgi:hypothetical protein